MMKSLLLICLLTVSIISTNSQVGVDVSDPVSQSEWTCLMSPGGQGSVEHAIVRIYQSGGNVDPNGATTMQNAIAAGISDVGAYIFPCFGCGDGGSQVNAAISALSGVSYSTLWYDIETYNWSSDLGTNQAFIQAMVDAGKAAGINAGIYSNYNNWQTIVGLDWTYPADQGLPLWYAHYDNSASFSDFSGFGNWATPTIKQYIGNANSCGVGVDYNYYG